MLLHYLAKVETVKMQKCSENCIKCVVYAHHNGPVDYKVNLGCHAAMRVRNKDL